MEPRGDRGRACPSALSGLEGLGYEYVSGGLTRSLGVQTGWAVLGRH